MRSGGGPVALAAALLAGCAGAQTDRLEDDGRAKTACLSAVAAHVGGSTEIVIERLADGPDGGSVYEVRDGAPGRDRLHLCEVDATGRVTALTHPGA